jgi:F0F1-type ATP synthase assembly protein I
MEQKQKNNSEGLKSYARYSSIVIEMLVIIGGGTWGGHLLDEKSSREFPLFTLLFSLIAVAIALFIVIRQVTYNDGKKK